MYQSYKSYKGKTKPAASAFSPVSSFWRMDLYFVFLAAKLGDTKELEDFIADLDRTLESKC